MLYCCWVQFAFLNALFSLKRASSLAVCWAVCLHAAVATAGASFGGALRTGSACAKACR